MAREYLKEIECSEQALDIAFHPKKENILACALVDGSLEVHDTYAEEDLEDDDEPDSIISSLPLHCKPPKHVKKAKTDKASCRSVTFSTDGQHIFTGGLHGDLCAVDATRVSTFAADTDVEKCLLWRINHATGKTPAPIQTLKSFEQSPLLAAGDDSGGVRIWDLRLCSSSKTDGEKNQACVMSWNEHKDYISGFDLHPDEQTLLASSADGRLGVFDLRKQGKIETKFRLSDDQEDELLSIKIMKNSKKVVCGTVEGILSIWSYGTWGDISDRLPGHPASIDAMLKVDEDVLLTGSSDGLIRVVQIHPSKFLGVLGSGHQGFPIEKLDFNQDRHIVGSLSHSPVVRLWDSRILLEDFDPDEISAQEDDELPTKESEAAGKTADADNSDDGWEDAGSVSADESKDASASDDSDDSDDSEGSGSGQNDHHLQKRLKTDNEKFFEDM